LQVFNLKLDRGSIESSPKYGIGPQLKKPHVLDLAVHLVNIVGWMVKGDNSKAFLLLALALFKFAFPDKFLQTNRNVRDHYHLLTNLPICNFYFCYSLQLFFLQSCRLIVLCKYRALWILANGTLSFSDSLQNKSSKVTSSPSKWVNQGDFSLRNKRTIEYPGMGYGGDTGFVTLLL